MWPAYALRVKWPREPSPAQVEMLRSIGDQADYGSASAINLWLRRRIKVSLVSKKTGHLLACQLLLGHRMLESTFRNPGIGVDDAVEMSEHVDLWRKCAPQD